MKVNGTTVRVWAIALVAALCCARFAVAKDDFLPPEVAYQYSTRVQGDQLIVTWKIEKGYYLYKKKMAVAVAPATPTNSPSPVERGKDGMGASAAVQLGTTAWPKGELHKDEYFGEQEIYRGTVEIPTPIIVQGARPTKFPLELKLQGCADAGLCYPPLTWKS